METVGLKPGGVDGGWYQPIRFVEQTVDQAGSSAVLTVGGTERALTMPADAVVAEKYREVAKELFISIKTVETHVSSVLRRLQLSNRHELTAWASTELADLDTVTLPEATSTRETTAAARSAADKALSDAAAERTRVTAAADAARSALLRAEAALSRAHERSEQLTQLLDGAPDAAEVSASLEILTGLERAERTALDGLRAAGRARDAAVAAERALRDELATADAQLRETREPLVPLGAPAVDTSDLPAAWAALAKWAATARTSADEALAKAETTAAEAGDRAIAAADTPSDRAQHD